jgi:hypothetical protein
MMAFKLIFGITIGAGIGYGLNLLASSIGST